MDLVTNFKKIQQCIETACHKSGRSPESIQLVAVSKGQPPEAVSYASDLGIRTFGESKVQEAKAKVPLCPSKLQWHMIGHLQTNKVRDALRLFEVIESIDSLKLALEVNSQAREAAKRVPVFLEVNMAGESSKFGFNPESLLGELKAINDCDRLEILGLMTIAPWTSDPSKVRPIFKSVRELKAKCEDLLGASLPHLSMGMSGDYEVAVEEGATIVRIGTALFGNRSEKKRA